jgi:hypothetical protein
MGKKVRQRKALEAGGSGGCVLCLRGEERLSFIVTEGGEQQAASGGETNSQEMN